jgi:hypothetical protein
VPETGPHIITATFCEKVLIEPDGVMSLIRLVDRFTQTATGLEPPAQMPPFVLTERDLRMVITLKSDQAKGRSTIKIVAEAPSGIKTPIGESDVNLPGGNQGVQLNIGVNFAFQHEGVYWFDVLLGGPHHEEDVLITRVPLEVLYQRQRVPASPRDQEDEQE